MATTMTDDELIEAMVKNAYNRKYGEGSFEKLKRIHVSSKTSWHPPMFRLMEAALSIARPVIREQALREAAAHFKPHDLWAGDAVVMEIERLIKEGK